VSIRIHKSIRGNNWNRWGLVVAVSTVVLLCAPSASAQISSSNPSQILQQYRSFRTTWIMNIWPYANTLFALLAVIEFAWSAAVMALEKTDLQSWTSALIRKIMWLGAFYALLLYGRQWIPAIIDSFSQLGGNAAGINGNQGLSPSDVFTQGLNIAASLMDAASSSAFFTNPGACLAVILAAALVMIGFIAVTIQYIVAVVESYLVVSAGVIFLGFGGSRWTTPYVERYIGLGVSIGVKIMILYMLIGVGMSLSGGWLKEAAGIGTSPDPSMTGFDVMGAALIFMMLCWQVPKLFAAVLGGSPALSGGDLVSTGTTAVAGAATVASLGAGAIAAAAGGAAALFGGARASGIAAGGAASSTVAGVSGGMGAAGSSGGGSVPPPSSPTPGPASGGRPKQPNPPSNGSASSPTPSINQTSAPNGGAGLQPSSNAPLNVGDSRGAYSPEHPHSVLASVGGDSLVGSGFEGERSAAGFLAHSIPIPTQRAGSSTAASASPASTKQPSTDASAPIESGSGAGTSTMSDVQSVSSGANAKRMASVPRIGERVASTARRTQEVFSGAAGRLRGARQKFGGLPSDAAPHTPPPRMPIDHGE
jgi:type IV secretion system protein TrbL